MGITSLLIQAIPPDLRPVKVYPLTPLTNLRPSSHKTATGKGLTAGPSYRAIHTAQTSAKKRHVLILKNFGTGNRYRKKGE